MNTPPPSGTPQPEPTPQPKLSELLAGLGYSDPAPPPDPPLTPAPTTPDLVERPLPELVKPSTPAEDSSIEPPWAPPPVKPERIRQPLSCGLQLLFVIVLLSLTAGCRVTDSTPVKFGLFALAGFLLYSIASNSGSSTAIRVILITIALAVFIPVAIVVFLFAVCIFNSNGFNRTSSAPPISSAYTESRH